MQKLHLNAKFFSHPARRQFAAVSYEDALASLQVYISRLSVLSLYSLHTNKQKAHIDHEMGENQYLEG